MARKPTPSPPERASEGVRLLMAAGAVFVFVAGLTLLTCLILLWGKSAQEATTAFIPFFLTGLVLFAASAMIDTEMVKAFLGALSPLKEGSK